MRFSIPSQCDRCGEETIFTTGSYFDESIVCLRCTQIEREHPDFHRARDTEVAQVQAGNYKFPGIGLPDDLAEKCRRARSETSRPPSATLLVAE